MTDISIAVTWGKTSTGKDWAVHTNIGDFVSIDGWGAIRLVLRGDGLTNSTGPSQALRLAKNLEQASIELMRAVKWVYENQDVLGGYDR